MIRYVVYFFISLLPDTRAYKLKALLFRVAGHDVSWSARIVSSVQVRVPLLSVGSDTFVGHNCKFIGGAAVRIGSNVDIAPDVLVATGSHEIGSSARRAGPGVSKAVFIEDGVWIGARSTVNLGVTIGCGAIVGSCSLVRADVPCNAVVVGVPAKPVRFLGVE